MEFEENELKSLEYRVDELILFCQRLQEENKTLRTKHADLISERADLLEKNELAKTRVEAMIMRLKSMEQNA